MVHIRRNRVLAIGGIIAASLLLGACSGEEADPGATGASGPDEETETTEVADLQPVTFRLDFLAQGLTSPFYLALERGYYEEEGLDVTIQEGRGALATLQSTAAGEIDVGYVSGDVFILGISQDLPVTAIGWIQRKAPNGIMVDADGDIDTLEDLVGKDILINPGSSDQFQSEAVLTLNGIDPESVNFVSTDPALKTSSYLAGEGDGVFLPVTFAAPILADRPSKALSVAEYGLRTMGTGLITNNTVLQERPEILGPFIRASLRGWVDAQEDGEASVQAMIKHLPDTDFDIDAHVEMLSLLWDFVETEATAGWPIGCMASEDWTASAEITSAYAPVERQVGDDIHDHWTNDFVGDCPESHSLP